MANAVIGWQRIAVWNTPFLPPSCTRACIDTSIIVGSNQMEILEMNWLEYSFKMTYNSCGTQTTTYHFMSHDHWPSLWTCAFRYTSYVVLPWLLFVGMHNDSMFLHALYLRRIVRYLNTLLKCLYYNHVIWLYFFLLWCFHVAWKSFKIINSYQPKSMTSESLNLSSVIDSALTRSGTNHARSNLANKRNDRFICKSNAQPIV